MDVITQRLHVRKTFIGVKVSLLIALALPTTVDIHVLVAGSLHATARQSVGVGADDGVALLPARESETVVPTHRGSEQVDWTG